MSTLIYEISSSLDGFTTAANVRAEEPMGDGGARLHAWASGGDPVGDRILRESYRRSGASIAGRRTYDLSIPWWGADGPGGSYRTPTFIVSHTVPDDVPEGGVYTFVGSAVEAARQARKAAGDRAVDVFSASIGNQLLKAGEVDQIWLHIAPVLFGDGTPLFEGLSAHVALELIGEEQSQEGLHARYRVIATATDS